MDSSEAKSDGNKPPKPNTGTANPASATCSLSSWPGPRTVLLKRNEHGFGFTLRHFIVYPPETLKDTINDWADSEEKLQLPFQNMEPMDTIFVKSVKPGGAADRAGLATGDRIVSVNGETIRGKPYSQVVQLIQSSDNNLQLLVVPKEDDILQLYFPGTAYHAGAEWDPQSSPPRPQQNLYNPSSSSSTSSSMDTLHRWMPPSAMESNRVHRASLSSEQPCQSSFNYQMTTNNRPRFSKWNQSYESAFKPSSFQMESGRSKSSSDLSPPRFYSSSSFQRSDGHSYDSNDNLEPRFVYMQSEPQVESFFGFSPVENHNNKTNQTRAVFSQYPSVKSDRYTQENVSNVQLGEQLSSRDKFFRSCNTVPLSWSNPSSRDTSLDRSSDPLTDRMKASHEKKQEFLFSSTPQENLPRMQYSSEFNRSLSPTLSQPKSKLTPWPTKFVASPHLPVFRPEKSQQSISDLPQRCSSNSIGFSTATYSSNTSSSDTRDGDDQFNRLAKPFISTLGRIQENITSGSLSDSPVKSTSNLHQNYGSPVRKATLTPLRKASSLDSDVSHSTDQPNENQRILQLQLVSQRAKLFESGGMENEAKNRVNMYRNELSRLANKGQTMTVSARTAQFESLSTSQETVSSESEASLISRHRISLEAKKESKELRWQRSQSDNVSPSYYISTAVPKTTPPPTTQSVQISSCDGHQMTSTTEPAYIDDVDDVDGNDGNEDIPNRRKAVRQNSYLQAVHSPYRDPLLKWKNDLNRLPSTPRLPSRILHPLSRESSSTPALHVTSNGLSSEQTPFLHENECSSLFEEGSISRLIAAFDNMLADNSAKSKTSVHSSTPTTSSSSSPGIVFRKKAIFEDDAQNARRVSYLKATSAERMQGDSDIEEENSNVLDGKTNASNRSHSIQKLKAFFGEKTPQIVEATEHMVKDYPSPVYDVVKEGWLQCKTAFLDGKRSADRSWKQLWACLRGSSVYLFKDKKDSHQLPLCLEEQPLVIKAATVDIAYDYTKKKNVFRLITPSGSEYLLQAEDNEDMLHWIKLIQEHYQLNNIEGHIQRRSDHVSRLSPQPTQKGIKKLTSFRNRSPTGQSPQVKVKRTTHTQEVMPKPKTWRGKMVKTIKKIHSTSSSNVRPEGITVNVPLEDCPTSSVNEFVPLIVELCTSIVEARGLEMVGIYRVPGNTAAVTALLEAVNKGFDNLNLQDARWNDVNVISSVLKAFFRKLPEPLISSDLYPLFIEANKLEDSALKLCTLKKLLHELPQHHYETLKYLIGHLQKIVAHSAVNKMESRNLAIVFGPTLVRAADDNMVTMVTDMSHQCCIVELLINKADWFFNEDDTDDVINQNIPESCLFPVDSTINQVPTNQNLLLNNIAKVEDVLKPREICARDIVTSIINAANRKVRQRVKKQNVCNTSVEDAGFEERDIDREVELRRQRVQKHQDSIDSSSVRPGSADKVQRTLNRDLNLAKRTISADSLSSLQMQSNSSLADSGNHDSTTDLFYYPHETSVMSSDKLGDEVVFRTYAGLSASTQERIRRFEMETRALLQRNLNRQSRDSERRQLERRRIEVEWQRAKQDLEQEILLDELASAGNKNSTPKHQTDLNAIFSDFNRNGALGTGRSIHSQSSSSDYSSNASPIVHHRVTDHYGLGPQTTGLVTSDYNSNTSSPLSTGSSDVKVSTQNTFAHMPPFQSKNEDVRELKEGEMQIRRGSSTENVGVNVNKGKLVHGGGSKSFEERKRNENPYHAKKVRLSSVRCGSLDSLREYYDKEKPRIDDSGGDLLVSIEHSLNQRLRGLGKSNENQNSENVSSENKEKENSTTPQSERKRRYRDPSLHRIKEKQDDNVICKTKDQKASTNIAKATLLNDKIHNAHRNCCSACPYLRDVNKTSNDNSKAESKPGENKCGSVSRQESNESAPEVNILRTETTTITATVSTTKNTITTSSPATSIITATIISKSDKSKLNELDSLQKNNNKCCIENNQRHNNNNNKNCNEIENSKDVEKSCHQSSSSSPTFQCKNVISRNVKRRHTVGGTKDFENFRLMLGAVGRKESQQTAWERLQPVVGRENKERTMKSWLERERLRTSSPDLAAQKMCHDEMTNDDGACLSRSRHRRISFPDIRVANLQLSKVIALESQV